MKLGYNGLEIFMKHYACTPLYEGTEKFILFVQDLQRLLNDGYIAGTEIC